MLPQLLQFERTVAPAPRCRAVAACSAGAALRLGPTKEAAATAVKGDVRDIRASGDRRRAIGRIQWSNIARRVLGKRYASTAPDVARQVLSRLIPTASRSVGHR